MKTINLQAKYRFKDKNHFFNFGVRAFRYTEGDTSIYCYYDGIADNEIKVPECSPIGMICELIEKFVCAEIKRTYNID